MRDAEYSLTGNLKCFLKKWNALIMDTKKKGEELDLEICIAKLEMISEFLSNQMNNGKILFACLLIEIV